MKRFFLLLFLLCHGACDIDFEDNRRLLIKGRIIDSEGNPRPLVSTVVTANSSRYQETIGSARTDTDGRFSMTTLSPSNANFLRLTINEGARLTQASYEFKFHLRDLVDHTFDVATRTIAEKTTATLRLRRLSSNNDTLCFGVSTREMIAIVSPSLTEEDIPFCGDFPVFDHMMLPTENNNELDIEVIPGDTICFSYRFANQIFDEGTNQRLTPTTANEYVFEF